jgi:hypothetical protein
MMNLYRGRGLAHESRGEFAGAHADHEMSSKLARADCARQVEWCALVDLGKLWVSRDYIRVSDYFECALELAR